MNKKYIMLSNRDLQRLWHQTKAEEIAGLNVINKLTEIEVELEERGYVLV